MSIPKTALPIVDWEEWFCGATDTLDENEMPLCPHCGEWSSYTTVEAEQRGGYCICQFCGGEMYMPSSHDCNVVLFPTLNADRNNEEIESEIDGKQPKVYSVSIPYNTQTEVLDKDFRFSVCDSCDGKHCKVEEILNGASK